MTTDEFWDLVDAARIEAHTASSDAVLESMSAKLAGVSPEEMVSFRDRYDEAMAQAYTWPLWGAAYIIGGGCSDDAFADFRSWLISMGRRTYQAALADPDSLAELDLGPNAAEDAFFEEFAYLVGEVYEVTTGEELPDATSVHPAEPSGEAWEEDGTDLSRRFPKLWKRYGDA